MVLDLKPIFYSENERIPLSFSLDFSGTEIGGIYPLRQPVQVSGQVESRADIVTLTLRCEVVYSAPCDRCGADADNHYTVPVSRVLVTSLSSDEENDHILAVENMQLDLSELVFSEVILNLPMKHLCKPDCKGVCDRCGQNLNAGTCDCGLPQGDPRLEALKQLLH